VRKSLSPCATKGCPTLTRESYCEQHYGEVRRELDSRRPNSAERGYDATWRKTRGAFIKTHPVCQDEAGCIATATDVHHLDGLGPKGPRGHDWSNLQSLCHSCHSKVTAREKRQGVGGNPDSHTI
jgi:5-methylcytosine-specific restriction protein A